jgi:hypothetical protein
MDVTALKALCALLPASLLLGGSAILFSKVRTLPIVFTVDRRRMSDDCRARSRL